MIKPSCLPSVSLIITTYNQPEILRLVLESVMDQVVLPQEIIIADDGSRPETMEMIRDMGASSPTRLLHVWQDDAMFRLARSRNNGIAVSSGEYLIFLDGDCFVNRHFTADHLELASQGQYLVGTRVNITPRRKDYILRTRNRRITFFSWGTGKKFNAIRSRFLAGFYTAPRGMAGANFSAWREDILQINGFNEEFVGHGYEDGEIACRLHNIGITRRRMVHFGMAYHFAHSHRVIGDESKALRLLEETVQKKIIRCEHGLDRAVSDHIAGKDRTESPNFFRF